MEYSIGSTEDFLSQFGIANSIKTERVGKGKSILDLPSSYVVVDIETTGLSPSYDEIIEISAIRYIDGDKSAVFETLIKPNCEISGYITELTGITDAMVEDAPDINSVIRDFKDFVGDDIIVGHNVNFDINFLYDNLNNCYDEILTNNFIDTMRVARRVLTDLKHHRLKDIADYYGIDYEQAHRATIDCEICNSCFVALKRDVEQKGISLETKRDYSNRKKLSAKDITTDITEFDEEHPLFGKVCAFTGTLEKMQRKDAMQLVANLGGIPGDGVTKKTNYLVLGNNDYCKAIKDGKSTKQKKAEQLILEGADLAIIPEQVFYDLVLD